MRARRLRVGVTLVLTLAPIAACGSGSTPTRDREGQSWPVVARTLTPGLDPRSPNVCKRGDARCLDAVVGEMRRRLEPLAASCDHQAPFAFMYMRVTEAVRDEAARMDFFPDERYIVHLDAVFARLYFDASDAWRAGKSDQVPRAWQLAFNAADNRLVTGIGDCSTQLRREGLGRGRDRGRGRRPRARDPRGDELPVAPGEPRGAGRLLPVAEEQMTAD